MIRRQIQGELLKLKRKGFWLLSFLMGFGIVALQMVNYGFRREYLLKQSENDWAFYLINISHFIPIALILGIAILTSYMASIEDETHSWKQALSMPVSKIGLYVAKSFVLLLFLGFSALVLMATTLGHGWSLDLGDTIPYLEIIKHSSYPYLAVFPVFSLQLWLAVISRNQAYPMVVGILGVILASISMNLPDWIIWKWPTLKNEWNQPSISVMLGLVVGWVIYLAGMIDFARRDVK